MVPLRWPWLVLTVMGITGIVYGVATGQMVDVAKYASRLCLDCIGLGGH